MDEKTLMWWPQLLLVLSDGHDLPPVLEQTASAAPLKYVFAFLCSSAISGRRHFDVLKECVPLISCHTETENTDIISVPSKLGPSAKLLSWSVKTRVRSGLILWFMFCRSAVRKPVSCMISDVVTLILAVQAPYALPATKSNRLIPLSVMWLIPVKHGCFRCCRRI